MKKIIFMIMCLAFLLTAAGCSSLERSFKTIGSDITNGLNRTVKVYAADGSLLAEYEGKIDLQDTEYGNKVLFDLDGRRYVFYNCSVIVEEK